MKKYIVFIFLLLQLVFIISCNTHKLEGRWKLADIDSKNDEIGILGIIKLLQDEREITFKFNNSTQLEILGKDNNVIEKYNYKLDKNNVIEITNNRDTQYGKLSFKSGNEVLMEFPQYAYLLKRN